MQGCACNPPVKAKPVSVREIGTVSGGPRSSNAAVTGGIVAVVIIILLVLITAAAVFLAKRHQKKKAKGESAANVSSACINYK